MSDNGLNITVESNENRLILHLEQFTPMLQAKLKEKITQLTNALLAQVKAAEPYRTGRLRAATRAYINERPDFVSGKVRILRTGGASREGAAFGALEYGAPGRRGRFQVRAYQRRSGSVSSYYRTAHLRAQRFLRGPAAAMRPQALAQLEAVVNQVIHEAEANL